MASDIKSQFALLTAPGAAYEMEQVEVFGRQCRSFKNAPPTLRALFEEVRSDAEFIYLDERLILNNAGNMPARWRILWSMTMACKKAIGSPSPCVITPNG